MNKGILLEIKGLREGNHSFQTIRKKVGEDRLREFFNTIYPKFTLPEIETITGIPDSTLSCWFSELELPLCRAHISNYSIPGDLDSEIVIKKGSTTKKIQTVKITPELAYLIGFALGDGSVQKYMVEVFNKDRKLREPLFEILKQYGPITEDEREDGLWRLRLSSGKIANLIRDNKEIRKDTIDYIFNDDLLAKKFIAGFWDAEGSVWFGRYNYWHIYLFNSDEYLLNKIKEFLKSKSIDFSIFKKYLVERKLKDGRIINSKKIVQRISIPKSSCQKWTEEIGIHMNHSKKSDNVKQILKYYGGNEK